MARRVLLSASMLKPALVAVLGVLGLASPVVAGKPQPLTKKPVAQLKKPNCGESYVLGARRAQTPDGDAKAITKKLLTDNQIGDVVKAKLSEVDYCWNRLPEDQRKADTTAVLKLEVDASGEVQTVDVVGDVPADAQRCISISAASWQFPETSGASHFDYAISLRAM